MMKGIQLGETLHNCYLLYGEETFVKDKLVKQIRERTVPEDDMMNYSLFEGKEIDVNKLIDTGETMPFFATHKLVVVKDSGYFKTGKKDDSQKLLKWLETLPEYAVFVFVEKEIDKRNSLYKWVHTKQCAVACECPDEDELVNILGKYCKESHLKISVSLLRYMIQNMPKSVHYMMGEIEKLVGYCGEQEVTKEAIQSVCIFSLEQRVFELLKEISKKNTTTALSIYNRLIESKESPIGILVLIARQYRMLMQVKYLVKQRMPSKQIAQVVGLPFFVAKELEEESGRLTFKQLQTILDLCLESDVAIKTGKMEQVKCIELLIMSCIYNK
ncbi:MAG: DNA polymerase III subunit delta [Cellulosilyticaceae bacterium]